MGQYMKKSGSKSLPVIMYHYVNDLPGGITVSPACFEEHCRVLAEHGWRGVGLEEAENFLLGEGALPARSVLFTFDDGFFDNYLYALPLLNAYGHKGVVFAVSNRLEAGAAPRAPLDGLLAGNAPAMPEVALPTVTTARGFSLRQDVFLNHAEARLMDAEGTLAVASHSRGHYGVYTGPGYKGFFRPRTRYRTFYRTEVEPVWGMPEFNVGAGLLHRAFLPAPELIEAIKTLVPQDFDGAADFFSAEANVRRLEALVQDVSGRPGGLGGFESEAERKDRMWREIAGGKEELERILGHGVRSLCWPWGDYCEEALALAKEAGFSVFFTTREGVNPPGSALAAHRFKGKPKSGAWLLSRARIYASPLVGRMYTRLRI